jgi:signal transduction histidine kinase
VIGSRFTPDEHLIEAFAGRTVAESGDLDKPESASEARLGQPLIEVYSPIHEGWTGRVIAVIEFYEYAAPMQDEIAAARRSSWAVVAGISGLTALGLFGIVARGSRTIDEQRGMLEAQVADLGRLARQNRDLRLRVQRASSGAAETNERYLSRIGADLHDGPAQLLSLASLRLDSLESPRDDASRLAEIDALRRALVASMTEIRNISRGLVLPELAGKTAGQVVRRAVDIHRALTRSDVALDLPDPDPALPPPKLIALYRFVQEALSNASRHAGGAGMAVRAETDAERIRVSVSDRGPGLPDPLPEDRAGLGLRGLGERVESLGGRFSVESRPGQGVTLTLDLALTEETPGA